VTEEWYPTRTELEVRYFAIEPELLDPSDGSAEVRWSVNKPGEFSLQLAGDCDSEAVLVSGDYHPTSLDNPKATTYTIEATRLKEGANRVTLCFEGRAESVSATRTVTKDTQPPETEIRRGPADGEVTGPDVRFIMGFESQAPMQVECSLDGAEFSKCKSTQDYTGLAPGRHVFSVRARDGAGNVDPTPAVRTWTVR
jgi:hypothetical protein